MQGPVLLAKTQPVAGSQPSSVQGLPSLQTLGLPGAQVPFAQASAVVHRLPSLHGAVLSAAVQPPMAEHDSVVHGLPSSHGLAFCGLQNPPLHASPSVHELLSSQSRLLNVKVQPLGGSHPSSVHGLPSAQVSALAGVQMPPTQLSPIVHVLPSEQDAVLGEKMQPVSGSQLSTVHCSPSLQTVAVPGMQTAPPHTSPIVQTLTSSHGALLGVCLQPAGPAQLSSVQTSPSVQVTSSVSPSQSSSTPLQISALARLTVVQVTCWKSTHATIPPAQAPLPHGLPTADCAPVLPSVQAKVSSMRPLQLSSNSLHSSAVGFCAATQIWVLPAQVGAPGQLPMSCLQVSESGSHRSPGILQSPSLAHAVPLPVAKESTVHVALAGKSSIVPLQSSSMPLQLSALASGPMHLPRPLAVHACLPVQVPNVLVTLHEVSSPELIAHGEQGQVPLVRWHWLVSLPTVPGAAHA